MGNITKIFKNITISSFPPLIAAIGVFDGVHPGHREIIRRAALRARSSGMQVLALSFSPHPRALLCPGEAPRLLIPESERVKLLKDAGADFCGFIDFTREIADLEPLEFLRALQDQQECRIGGICVGSNWKFGRQGRGDRELLAGFCRENGWSFDAVEELEFEGVTISSSAIRNAVARGDLDYARAMSGREIRLYGTVGRGFHIASDKLEAPTANLEVSAGVLPPDGVYSGSVQLDEAAYPAAVNIGVAPTFGNGVRRVEVHLIGFAGSLYGRELSVVLHRFMRQEKRFDSPEELKKQIAIDINIIKDDHTALR